LIQGHLTRRTVSKAQAVREESVAVFAKAGITVESRGETVIIFTDWDAGRRFAVDESGVSEIKNKKERDAVGNDRESDRGSPGK
jgi:hypothetical protein